MSLLLAGVESIDFLLYTKLLLKMALHYEDGTDMDIIMLRQLAAFYRDAIDD
jgi:hypothetical protein